MLLGAIVTVVACRRPSSEPSAPPPAVPRFTPQFHASLLPPFFRSLKFGDTTFAEAEALLPPNDPALAVRRIETPQPGACLGGSEYGVVNRALGGTPMSVLAVESQTSPYAPRLFGSDLSELKLCFATLPGRSQPVLVLVDAVQMVVPSHAIPSLCMGNSRLQSFAPAPSCLGEWAGAGYRCVGDRSGFFEMFVQCSESLPGDPSRPTPLNLEHHSFRAFIVPSNAQPGLPSPLPDRSAAP